MATNFNYVNYIKLIVQVYISHTPIQRKTVCCYCMYWPKKKKRRFIHSSIQQNSSI